MEEFAGRIILNENEARRIYEAATHPDRISLQRRDNFLSRFAGGNVVYEPDGSMCFELTELIAINLGEFFNVTNLNRPTITTEDNNYVDAA